MKKEKKPSPLGKGDRVAVDEVLAHITGRGKMLGIVVWAINMLLLYSVTYAAQQPTCVLMKFTDDTRYDLVESADMLSDLVMEKMVASGRFNLKETRPLDENMEAMLYDEKMQELSSIERGMKTGDFDAMFEGEGFRENKAQSIATASVGQFVTPSITAEIGKAHQAEYLVQGTIINLGTGNWWNEDYELISSAINLASALAGATAASNLLGSLGGLGGLAQGIDITMTGIGVQTDVRIIKAETGEVVWSKRVVGLGTQKQVGLGFFTIGTSKLSANLYAKAMDRAATKIVDALIADMDTGKLFLK